MDTKGKDVAPVRKAVTAASSNVSKHVGQAKTNPKASISSIEGSTDKAATGKPLPNYLKSTVSSLDHLKTGKRNDASESQAKAKTARRLPSLKSTSSAPSTLHSSLPRRSHPSSPPSRSGKASTPATATTELGRSISSKTLRLHEKHPTNAITTTNKLVTRSKNKSVPSSNHGRQMHKVGRDSVSVGSQEDQIEEKVMTVQESQDSHCGESENDSSNSTISDDDIELHKAKGSEDQREDYETSSVEKSPSNTSLEAEIDESGGNGNNEDASLVKANVGADTYAATDAHDAGETQNEEKAEEEHGAVGDETSDNLRAEPEENRKNEHDEKEEEEHDDGDETKVATPRIQSEAIPRVKGTEGQEDSPRKLSFRRGTIISPKADDDTNQPRRLIFKQNRQVQNEGGADGTKENDEQAEDKDQAAQAKKENAVVFNQVIEDTASKLIGAGKKKKVLALVGAFETVISMQETNTQSSQGHALVQSPAAPASVSDPNPALKAALDPSPASAPPSPTPTSAPASAEEVATDDNSDAVDSNVDVPQSQKS